MHDKFHLCHLSCCFHNIKVKQKLENKTFIKKLNKILSMKYIDNLSMIKSFSIDKKIEDKILNQKFIFCFK